MVSTLTMNVLTIFASSGEGIMEARERTDQIRQTIDVMMRTMHLHHRIVEKRIDF